MNLRIAKVALIALALVLLSGSGLDAAQAQTLTTQLYTQSVGQQIPDGPSGGGAGTPLLSTINVPLGSIVSGIEVYLNISMVDWTSDLIVRLTSPGGTTLGLAWVGGGGIPATNIVGWFPLDFTPHDDMSQWIGEFTEGAWVLDCRDYSNGHVGTLNSWQLKITYDSTVANDQNSWGMVKALFR